MPYSHIQTSWTKITPIHSTKSGQSALVPPMYAKWSAIAYYFKLGQDRHVDACSRREQSISHLRPP